MHTYVATVDPPKPKYGLIAHIDMGRDSVVLFLISTELAPFISGNATLVKGITKIDCASHPCLEYDSWLRFGDAHACQHSELMRQIGKGEKCFCGHASDALLTRLIKLIPLSPEIAARWQQRYIEALTAEVDVRARGQ